MPVKKLVVEWMPAGDTKDTMARPGGKREVIVPGELENTATQHEKMRQRASKPAQQLRKDGDPETAFKMRRKSSNALIMHLSWHITAWSR
jgi:isoquinoline 1-oxidoreductase beta subunit